MRFDFSLRLLYMFHCTYISLLLCFLGFFFIFHSFSFPFYSINIYYMLFTHQCVSLFLMGTSTIYQSLRGHVVSLFTPTRAEHDFRYGPFQGPFYTYVPPYDCAALLVVFTSPPKAALFSPHSALRYSHQSPHSIPYYVTPPTTPHDTHSSSSSQHQDGGLHARPRCSLLPTLRNTIYQTSRRHRHFTPWRAVYLHLSKNTFSKIFLGPFPGPRGLLPLIFEFPYSRCIS